MARPDGTAIIRLRDRAAATDAAMIGHEVAQRIKADMPLDFFVGADRV